MIQDGVDVGAVHLLLQVVSVEDRPVILRAQLAMSGRADCQHLVQRFLRRTTPVQVRAINLRCEAENTVIERWHDQCLVVCTLVYKLVFNWPSSA